MSQSTAHEKWLTMTIRYYLTTDCLFTASMGEIEKVGESENLGIKNHLRNLISVRSKFVHSGWKSLRLTNEYNTRHLQSGFEMSHFDIVTAKKSNLTPKNLIKVSFTTEK
jgi:hypothetical protein